MRHKDRERGTEGK